MNISKVGISNIGAKHPQDSLAAQLAFCASKATKCPHCGGRVVHGMVEHKADANVVRLTFKCTRAACRKDGIAVFTLSHFEG